MVESISHNKFQKDNSLVIFPSQLPLKPFFFLLWIHSQLEHGIGHSVDGLKIDIQHFIRIQIVDIGLLLDIDMVVQIYFA